MAQKEYLDLSGVSRFLYNIKNLFANISHTHTKSEITDLIIDSSLSSSSTNPVQNKVINSALSDHANNTNIHFTAAERTKLSSVEEGANKYEHPNSGVTAGTYKSVTVNAQGHVTGGTNPTTLSGYGITDAETKGTANAAVSTHNTATDSHNDIRGLITALTTKVNNFLDVDDTKSDQLSEVLALITENQDLIEGITTSKVNVSDIINNLTTNVSNKPLSAAQGVAIKALIDALQEEVDSKAAASDLTSHTGNTTVHITSTERTNWNDANSKKHGHTNKTVLDNTTASYTTEDKTNLDAIVAEKDLYVKMVVSITEPTDAVDVWLQPY